MTQPPPLPPLFIDKDGVMADFDTAALKLFGKPARDVPEWAMWTKLKNTPKFYATLPMMPDARQLWDYVSRHDPAIATGCPSAFFDQAAEDKREWVARNLGPTVPVHTCKSKDKCKLIKVPRSVLVDDWTKYAHLWQEAGGIFIHHTSADSTIEQLMALGY